MVLLPCSLAAKKSSLTTRISIQTSVIWSTLLSLYKQGLWSCRYIPLWNKFTGSRRLPEAGWRAGSLPEAAQLHVSLVTACFSLQYFCCSILYDSVIILFYATQEVTIKIAASKSKKLLYQKIRDIMGSVVSPPLNMTHILSGSVIGRKLSNHQFRITTT